MGEVVGLNVYPLKGALPVTVDGTAPTTLEVRPSGLAAVGEGYDYGDREFFIAAREADGEWAVVTPRGWTSDNNKVVYL